MKFLCIFVAPSCASVIILNTTIWVITAASTGVFLFSAFLCCSPALFLIVVRGTFLIISCHPPPFLPHFARIKFVVLNVFFFKTWPQARAPILPMGHALHCRLHPHTACPAEISFLSWRHLEFTALGLRFCFFSCLETLPASSTCWCHFILRGLHSHDTNSDFLSSSPNN